MGVKNDAIWAVATICISRIRIAKSTYTIEGLPTSILVNKTSQRPCHSHLLPFRGHGPARLQDIPTLPHTVITTLSRHAIVKPRVVLSEEH